MSDEIKFEPCTVCSGQVEVCKVDYEYDEFWGYDFSVWLRCKKCGKEYTCKHIDADYPGEAIRKAVDEFNERCIIKRHELEMDEPK